MSYLRYLGRRAAFAVLSVYAAVTAAFFLADYMWRYRLKKALGWASLDGALTEAERERVRREFVQQRNLDDPIHVRYAEWIVDVTTLDFGYSYAFGRPVVELLAEPTVTTLTYVVPGVVLAMVLGAVLGVATAFTKDSYFDRSARFAAYCLLAFPAFVTVDYVVYLLTNTHGVAVADSLVYGHPRAFATVLVAVSLLAGQVRFVRAASLDQAGEDFVHLLRAKGANRVRIARHVLRNAALPIVSMSTEIIPVLTLDVFVIEEVLPIDGLSSVILRAISEGAVSVLVWSSMVFVVIAIGGNFVVDSLYGYLDPRVRAD